ncbi:hypothetical protein V500_04926 [Pseudogymnoascus sp. VKM F-4518 (FW-2643)]|nr:hypothetical protein V500_04926 [Pseudogymnoascus sp. VKM F-4518 (FW-2643)]
MYTPTDISEWLAASLFAQLRSVVLRVPIHRNASKQRLRTLPPAKAQGESRATLCCDAEKPCLLCRRVGVECESRTHVRRTPTASVLRKSKKRVDGRPSPSGTAAQQSPGPSETSAANAIVSLRSDRSDFEPPAHRSADPQVAEKPQFGANTSAIDFAKNLYGREASNDPNCAASIPTEFRTDQSRSRNWAPLGMDIPHVGVMHNLIDEYFQRCHWFIYVFHEPTLRKQAREVLGRESWKPQERGAVLATFMAAAMALQAVSNEESWAGHHVLKEQGMDCISMLNQLIAEVRRHLLDLLEDCQIEAVQVCILLGTFYMFNGNPNLAWAVLGMATRAGYALALHSPRIGNQDKVMIQIRRRCWNHLKVADTYASMIYGRPTSLDPAFGSMQPLEDLDDTIVSANSLNIPAESDVVSHITFYNLKYRMYDIVAEILSRLRLLKLRSPPSFRDWASLQQIIHEGTEQLECWRADVPLHLNLEHWRSLGINGSDAQRFENNASRLLFMQAVAIDFLYDATVILLHRPVLETTIPTLQSSQNPWKPPDNEQIKNSLDISVAAATRVSNAPIHFLANQTIISYALMHLFTAGVILCIPPHTAPFSAVAQNCKSAVVRIITASKKLHRHSPVAGLTQKLLSDLLRITIQREIDAVLHQDVADSQGESDEQVDRRRYNNCDQQTESGPKPSEAILSSLQQSAHAVYVTPDESGDGSSYWSGSNTAPLHAQTPPDQSNIRRLDPAYSGNRFDLDAHLGSFYFNDFLDTTNNLEATRPTEVMWPFQAFGHGSYVRSRDGRSAATLLKDRGIAGDDSAKRWISHHQNTFKRMATKDNNSDPPAGQLRGVK